jgi:trehalose utilization protein
MVRALLLFFIFVSLHSACFSVEKIHVLIWDEQQPRQAEAYENFLGNEIASQLKKSSEDFEIRSVSIKDSDQGLADGNLDWADVIIWWGHVRHSDVTEENTRKVVDHIESGELDLIALHSAHWARPFVESMNRRSIRDAKTQLKEAGAENLTIETIKPPRERTVPIHGAMVTPTVFGYKKNRTNYHAIIHLPYCCFPDYRPDGKPGTITVKAPDHPIAKGLSKTFQVKQTEMYNEPFHVPDPDQVIFEETWERGERFRSGMVWKIGKGKVFYFRPGHETYPVFKQPEVIQVLTNATRWLGGEE